MRKLWIWVSVGSLALIITVVLCALAPWIDGDLSLELAIQEFEKVNATVQDGCGFNCEDCGPSDAKKVFFGYNVVLEYNCGGPYSNPSEIPQNFTTNAFVSFLQPVHIKNFE